MLIDKNHAKLTVNCLGLISEFHGEGMRLKKNRLNLFVFRIFKVQQKDIRLIVTVGAFLFFSLKNTTFWGGPEKGNAAVKAASVSVSVRHHASIPISKLWLSFIRRLAGPSPAWLKAV